MEESKILELLFARAENAVAALEKQYGKLLYRICYQILGRDEDARECVNDTYLALWNAIPPERPRPLTPYVCKVGRNIALKRLREDTAQKRCSRSDLPLEELSAYIPGSYMDDTLTARALGQAIDAFLSTQTNVNRNLFLRRYWFGDSVQEAAKLLGLSPNAASVRLSRMRDALKDYLIREELYCEL